MLAWPLLNQSPSPVALAGIAIVVLGVYVLNLKGKYLHNPLGIFKGDKANLHMMLNLLLIAIAGVLNVIAIKASEPLFFGLVGTLGAVPVLFASALLFRVKELGEVRRHIVPLSISGGLFGASFLTHMIAISLGPLAHISAVRGSSAVIGAVLGMPYLKESSTIPKVVALGLITLGSIVIGLHLVKGPYRGKHKLLLRASIWYNGGMHSSVQKREKTVEQAVANEKLEGLEVSQEALRIAQNYVTGKASAKSAAAKIRARYGKL